MYRPKGTFVNEEDQKQYSYITVLRDRHKAENGSYKTTSLIYESRYNDKTDAVFTLKDCDYINDQGQYLFSLRRLFLEIADPTEYEFAIQVLGSWRAWERLRSAVDVSKVIDDWRDELTIKMASQAISGVKQLTESEKDPVALAASKYIAERGWIKHKKGRPSKEEKERELKIASGIDKELDDDYERIQSQS